jgi:hypothetical protein
MDVADSPESLTMPTLPLPGAVGVTIAAIVSSERVKFDTLVSSFAASCWMFVHLACCRNRPSHGCLNLRIAGCACSLTIRVRLSALARPMALLRRSVYCHPNLMSLSAQHVSGAHIHDRRIKEPILFSEMSLSQSFT